MVTSLTVKWGVLGVGAAIALLVILWIESLTLFVALTGHFWCDGVESGWAASNGPKIVAGILALIVWGVCGRLALSRGYGTALLTLLFSYPALLALLYGVIAPLTWGDYSCVQTAG
jgi:hypothetical protein